MKTYLIGYDLISPGQDYEELFDAIKSLSKIWWHSLDSTWIIKTNMSAVDIRNSLLPYLDTNDEILVVSLDGESAWKGFKDKSSQWLDRNILPD
ncbi:MAG: hypothetical protein ACO1OF_16260 [Adhaeribacter sp.]